MLQRNGNTYLYLAGESSWPSRKNLKNTETVSGSNGVIYRYAWSGNVRELADIIQMLVITEEGSVDIDALPRRLSSSPGIEPKEGKR